MKPEPLKRKKCWANPITTKMGRDINEECVKFRMCQQEIFKKEDIHSAVEWLKQQIDKNANIYVATKYPREPWFIKLNKLINQAFEDVIKTTKEKGL